MSQENVDAARHLYAAWNRGDRDAVLEGIAPEAVWRPSLGALTDEQTYRGNEAIAAFLFDEVPQILEGFSAEVLEIRDLGGDLVLVSLRARGRASRAEMEIEQVFWHLITLGDGKVVDITSYTSDDEALEAVGLRE